jgi:hypothetical protein
MMADMKKIWINNLVSSYLDRVVEYNTCPQARNRSYVTMALQWMPWTARLSRTAPIRASAVCSDSLISLDVPPSDMDEDHSKYGSRYKRKSYYFFSAEYKKKFD